MARRRKCHYVVRSGRRLLMDNGKAEKFTTKKFAKSVINLEKALHPNRKIRLEKRCKK